VEELPLLGLIEMVNGECRHDGFILSREWLPGVVHDAQFEARGLVGEASASDLEHLRRDVHQRETGAGKGPRDQRAQQSRAGAEIQDAGGCVLFVRDRLDDRTVEVVERGYELPSRLIVTCGRLAEQSPHTRPHRSRPLVA